MLSIFDHWIRCCNCKCIYIAHICICICVCVCKIIHSTDKKNLLLCLVSKAPKFQRICHYSRSVIGCPAGLVIKINSSFWGRRSRDVCRYISITNCGLDKIATTTKDIQHQCNRVERCELHASESETYLSNPCPGIRKYLEVNYSCVASKKQHA